MSDWRTRDAPRWAASLLLAFAAVAVLANLAKWFIEANSDVVYEIHWFETVPFITLAFAFFIQRGLADQGRRAERGTPSAVPRGEEE